MAAAAGLGVAENDGMVRRRRGVSMAAARERERQRDRESRGKREEQERGEHGVGALLDPRGSEGGSGIAEERTRARRHGGGSVSTVATGKMPILQITPCHFSSFLFLFS